MIRYTAVRPNHNTNTATPSNRKLREDFREPGVKMESLRGGGYKRKIPSDGKHAAVLAIITAAALAGEVCPTNKAIGDRLDMHSTSQVSMKISELAAMGVIEVQRFNSGRVIKIVSSGHATAMPSCVTPHWRLR